MDYYLGLFCGDLLEFDHRILRISENLQGRTCPKGSRKLGTTVAPFKVG
jgi:hypothetical protein